MAMSIIQKLARQAYQTFGRTSEPAVQQERLGVLKELLTKVTCEEVHFEDKWLTCGDINGEGNEVVEGAVEAGGGGLPDDVHDHHDDEHAPVTYVHLWEDTSFSMGLFVLRKGVTLPLHDHPGMYGLIKVLHGKALITSYSCVPGPGKKIPADVKNYLKKRDVIPDLHHIEIVNKLPDEIVDVSSPPCALSPESGNFHEINSVDGPMAFLDILAPPYEHANHTRVCHYYSELTLPRHFLPNSVRYLVQVQQPTFFWCDQATYTGPELSSETVTGLPNGQHQQET